MTNSVGKGDPIIVPLSALNRSKEIWGEDALEFRYGGDLVDLVS